MVQFMTEGKCKGIWRCVKGSLTHWWYSPSPTQVKIIIVGSTQWLPQWEGQIVGSPCRSNIKRSYLKAELENSFTALLLSLCVQDNVVTKFICFQAQVTIKGPDSREESRTLLPQWSSCKYISPSAPDCSARLTECFMGPIDITCSQVDGHSVLYWPLDHNRMGSGGGGVWAFSFPGVCQTWADLYASSFCWSTYTSKHLIFDSDIICRYDEVNQQQTLAVRTMPNFALVTMVTALRLVCMLAGFIHFGFQLLLFHFWLVWGAKPPLYTLTGFLWTQPCFSICLLKVWC